MRKTALLIITLLISSVVFSQPVKNSSADTLEIYFRQSYSLWEPQLMGNEERLKEFLERFRKLHSDKVFNKISKIHIISGCSPEGYWSFNQKLSLNRANSMRAVLKNYITLPDSVVVVNSLGINWQGLEQMINKDPNLPYKDEVLEKLKAPEVVKNEKGKLVEVRKLRLMYLRDGIPWRYMYKHYFPTLRMFNLQIVIEWEKFEAALLEVRREDQIPAMKSEYIPIEYVTPLPPPQPAPTKRNPFFMGVKTNLLYDAVAVPNIGVEFYLGRDWTVHANWMYAWWHNDAQHNYWRIYGGDLGFRKWFGRAAKYKPLTGHHIGVYGQMFTYDFERGGRGYMGGKPGGTLWDKANYIAAIEYGYALPIARRLNLDFSLGLGYMGGEYHEYIPMDDCYVWQVTKNRRYFGPTKAEISLVWLWGYGNVNKGKGRSK